MEKNDIKQALKNIKEYEHVGSFFTGVLVVSIVVSGAIYGMSKLKFKPFSFNQPTRNVQQVTPTITISELKELPTTPDLYPKDGQVFVKNLPATYIVKQGDSSWKVALAVFGAGENYRDIEVENKMSPNQDLVVGQMITLPNVPSKKEGSNDSLKVTTVAPTLTVQPTTTPNVTPTPQTQGNGLPTKHTVQKSEGLWQIAQKYYNDGNQYLKIYNANKDKMKSPEDVQVGMELVIPQ